MGIDWKSKESYERLLGALVAASDNTVDYKKVAYFFGEGATYDSIEGRFRIAKKMAVTLQEEAETEGRKMPSSSRKKSSAAPSSAPRTPRKPKAANPAGDNKDNVMSGRVTKTATPRKKKAAVTEPVVKDEPQTPNSLDYETTGGGEFDFDDPNSLASMHLASFEAGNEDWAANSTI